MERAELMAIFGPLALALRANFSSDHWLVYLDALSDIPPRWLQAAADALMKQDRQWFPRPGEIRAIAATALREEQARLRAADCEACGNTRWKEVVDVDGVKRAMRCDCELERRAALAALGSVTLALPAVRPGTSDLERFDPKLAQLGADR